MAEKIAKGLPVPASPTPAGRASLSIARRLSVIYLFLFALTLFILFYYFKYIPDNKASFEASCFRQLKTANRFITKRSEDIQQIFTPKISEQEVINKEISFKRLDELYPYDTITLKKDSLDFEIRPTDQGYCFLYRVPSSKKNLFVFFRVSDLIGPVLTAPDELFDDYVLLADSNASSAGNAARRDVIFQTGRLTSSRQFSLDTLRSLFKNSDLSGTVEEKISGTPYEIFLSSFKVNRQNLILCGLVRKDHYSSRINQAPPGLSTFYAAFVFLLVISLPFIKVFMLSPKERIGFKDVVFCGLSVFVGLAILIAGILSLYAGANMVLRDRERLEEISKKLKSKFEDEYKKCNEELWREDKLLMIKAKEKDSKFQDFLNADTQTNQKLKDYVDKIFSSVQQYGNIERLFWIDAKGKTLGKWNPFNFFSPHTSVKDYEYFIRLSAHGLADTTAEIYPAISNATGEYQMVVAARTHDFAKSYKFKEGYPQYSVIAAYFDASVEPVLPEDFNFSFMDNATGNVLLSSDKRQILQENLKDEFEGNDKITGLVDKKSDGLAGEVVLRGNREEMFVTQLSDLPISLIVYYDKGNLFNHTLRIFFFSMEMLIALYILMAFILVGSGLKGIKKSILQIRTDAIEWFRVVPENERSYLFTKNYFFSLLIWTLVCILLILLFQADNRAILFIAFLAPFFAAWAFVNSRFTDNARNRRMGRDRSAVYNTLFRTLPVTGLFIIVNYILLGPFAASNSVRTRPIFPWVFTFETVALAMMLSCFIAFFGKPKKNKTSNEILPFHQKLDHRAIAKNYLHSLTMAVALGSVIPSIFITLFAIRSETIQEKKHVQFAEAQDMIERIELVNRSIIDNYDDFLRKDQAFLNQLQAFKNDSGQYITDNDSLSPGWRRGDKLSRSGTAMDIEDEPYITVMDKTFLFPPDPHGAGNLHAEASATTKQGWRFSVSSDHGDWLTLEYPFKGDTAVNFIFARTALDSWSNIIPQIKHWPVLLSVALLIVLILIGVQKIIRQTISCLFLIDLNGANPIFTYWPMTIDDILLREKRIEPYYFPGLKTRVSDPWSMFADEMAPVFPHSEVCTRDTYIMANQEYFGNVYDKLWSSLSDEEKWVTFDFCTDGYTNYKDLNIVYRLWKKGIFVFKNFSINIFSESFHNYVSNMRRDPKIKELKARVSVAGSWSQFQIPVLILIVIIGIFLAVTQDSLMRQVTALGASLGALRPLVSNLVDKLSSKTLGK